MVAWLLQHQLITEVGDHFAWRTGQPLNTCSTLPYLQLNTYVFLVPANDDSQGTATQHHTVEEDSSVKQLQVELSHAELLSVLSCPGAEDARELARFATLVRYFRGGWSIADMAQEEQLLRTNILTTVDMFSAVLVTATIPDPT